MRTLSLKVEDTALRHTAGATQRGGRYYGFNQLGVDWRRLMKLDNLPLLTLASGSTIKPLH